MNPTPHPTAEQLADLGAGTLPADEAMLVNAHVAGCADCRGLRDALPEVTAVLAAAGQVPEAMPADVATSLHAALRTTTAESRFAVARVDAHVSATRRRRPAGWLAGAAAAVVVTCLGVAAWEALPHDGSDQGVASSAQSDRGFDSSGPVGGSAPAGQDPLGEASLPDGASFVPDVTSASLAAAARRLSMPSEQSNAVLPLGRCETPPGSGRLSLIRWHGELAVLRLQLATRTATVLDCSTPRRALFATRY